MAGCPEQALGKASSLPGHESILQDPTCQRRDHFPQCQDPSSCHLYMYMMKTSICDPRRWHSNQPTQSLPIRFNSTILKEDIFMSSQWQGFPWGFPGQPVPQPIKICTHLPGYRFWHVGVMGCHRFVYVQITTLI